MCSRSQTTFTMPLPLRHWVEIRWTKSEKGGHFRHKTWETGALASGQSLRHLIWYGTWDQRSCVCGLVCWYPSHLDHCIICICSLAFNMSWVSQLTQLRMRTYGRSMIQVERDMFLQTNRTASCKTLHFVACFKGHSVGFPTKSMWLALRTTNAGCRRPTVGWAAGHR